MTLETFVEQVKIELDSLGFKNKPTYRELSYYYFDKYTVLETVNFLKKEMVNG